MQAPLAQCAAAGVARQPTRETRLAIAQEGKAIAPGHDAKPFEPQELLACVRLLLRRTDGQPRQEDAVTCGDLRLEPGTFLLRCGQREVRLSRREYDLMELLIRSYPQIVPKEQLILKVWGYDSDAEDNNVEVYISFLRRKLEHLHSAVKIRTHRLVGYCLEVGA